MTLPHIKPNLFAILSFLIFGFLFWHFAKEMLIVKSDGLYVGQVNLYGDLVFHLTLINKFLESGKILPDSPIFASSQINYPIFADFVTSQLAKITSIDFSLFITTFLAGIITIFAARIFISNFFRNEKIIFLSLLLFLFNGGFGFILFFQDLFVSTKNPVDFLFLLPREYTDIKDGGYWWINNYLAYFLPQRGFLFAFPITLTVLSLLFVGFKKNKHYLFIIAGFLAGVLPLVQAHSLFFIFLVSSLFLPISLFFSPKNLRLSLFKSWALFAIITTAIAIPIFRLIAESANPLKFVKFDPAWTANENIILFWFKNLGIFLPVLIFALGYIYKHKRQLLLLYFPFITIFLLSNIFIFQPWKFDNGKLLIYWYFASCILAAYFMYEFFFRESTLKKIAGTIIVFLMIFSAFLDIFRTFTNVGTHRIFSQEDVSIAGSVKNLTNKNAIFINAPVHNHPITALTGRSTLVGYHGWLWTHGIDYQKRAQDVEKIYKGLDFESLISEYRISYITVGPHETREFVINQRTLANYPRVILGSNWSLYDVSNIWANGNGQN